MNCYDMEKLYKIKKVFMSEKDALKDLLLEKGSVAYYNMNIFYIKNQVIKRYQLNVDGKFTKLFKTMDDALDEYIKIKYYKKHLLNKVKKNDSK